MEPQSLDGTAHFLGGTQCILKLGTDQEADEFLAAEAGEEVDPASAATQGYRHFAQYGIATAMAAGIVDRLEAVDVPNQDCDRVAKTIPAREFLGKALIERHPIGDPRQCVDAGALLLHVEVA